MCNCEILYECVAHGRWLPSYFTSSLYQNGSQNKHSTTFYSVLRWYEFLIMCYLCQTKTNSDPFARIFFFHWIACWNVYLIYSFRLKRTALKWAVIKTMKCQIFMLGKSSSSKSHVDKYYSLALAINLTFGHWKKRENRMCKAS